MKKIYITATLLLFGLTNATAQDHFTTVRIFPAKEAYQAVAVDSTYFYAIASRKIGKYDKKSGQPVKRWKASEDSPILHLDSGVIVKEKLYAAHSNYPRIPMTSSVEVWNTKKMSHTESHSFGIGWGSLTWIDRHNGYWWGVFAHYDEFEKQTGKNNRWTTLVKFNDQWQRLEAWKFPENMLEKFGSKSNSGGSWGTDGKLYISGHDRAELYVVKLPRSGSVLQHITTLPIENEGQGIAWDRSEENIIYTTKRSSREVIISRKNDTKF